MSPIKSVMMMGEISLVGKTIVVVVLLMMGAVCGNGNGHQQQQHQHHRQQQQEQDQHMNLMIADAAAVPAPSVSRSHFGGSGNGNGGNGGGGGGGWNGFGSGSGKAEIETVGNVTVLAGQTGQLKCRVTNLANYTVSWIRHRDTHLLTSGSVGYTADQRFRAFQGPGNIWGLRISSTRLTDSGVYECQISTTPPIPAFTHLSVVEPVTHIEGLNERRSELFIKAGSTINLTCVVEDATDNAPKHILWRHNSRMINFEWARGGMSLLTEKKTKGVTVSRLLIQKAMRADSGTYECMKISIGLTAFSDKDQKFMLTLLKDMNKGDSVVKLTTDEYERAATHPQNAHPAYVKIHVLEQGENQAAMQSKAATLLSPITPLLSASIFFVFFVTIAVTATFDLDFDFANKVILPHVFRFTPENMTQCPNRCARANVKKNYQKDIQSFEFSS